MYCLITNQSFLQKYILVTLSLSFITFLIICSREMFCRAANMVACTKITRRTPRLNLGLMRKLNSLNNNQSILSEIRTVPFTSESLFTLNQKLQVTIKVFSNPELHELVDILHDKNINTYCKEKVANSESIISTIR